MICLFLSTLLLITPAQRDSLLSNIPGNAHIWRNAFETYSEDTLKSAEFLFASIQRDDRAVITTAVLNDHLLSAMESRSRWYQDLPDSIFHRYLVSYRIADEPLSSYRSALSAWLARRVQIKPGVVEMAEEIQSVIFRNIDVVTAADGAASPSPTQILPFGQASEEGIWILEAACMRSMGIPVRPVKGWFPGVDRNVFYWLDVWTPDGWYTLLEGIPSLDYVKVAVEYPSMENVTGAYRTTGTLAFQPLVDFQEGWLAELMVISGDDSVAVDGINIDPFDPDTLELGPGEYIVRVTSFSADEILGRWADNAVISANSITDFDLNQAQYSITPLP